MKTAKKTVLDFGGQVKPSPLLKDRSGFRYGKLLVETFAGRSSHGSTKWKCKCDCGKTTTVLSCHLATGHTHSCGCAVSNAASITSKTHGHSRSNTYKIWIAMKSRCLNKNLECYKYYGGRGIKVCTRWLHSFENFLEDMGERPEGLSIDRIDNDGNYEPANCRWATEEVQQFNKRSNRILTLNGISLPISKWAERVGIKNKTLSSRINDHKWSVGRALTEKVA